MADLTTLANVRQFLQKQGSDTATDAVISALITRASGVIADFCERQFSPETAATHTFEFEQSSYPTWLSLAPYDLRTVTTVQLDPDVGAYTLDVIEYRLTPLNIPQGVYTGIRLQPLSFGQGRWRYRQVAITGDWGFASVPATVEEACIETVAAWLRRDVSAFETTFTMDEMRVDRPEGIPAGARAKLGPYKRLAFD